MEEKKVVISEEDFTKIDRMLKGVATKYNGWGGIEWDDLYQECWLKTMKLIEDNHGEIPDMNLICQSCYNRIFDLGRYQARRVNQIPVDISSFDRDDTEDSGKGSFYDTEFNSQSSHLGSDFYSDLFCEEIENLFPKGSKEREFVRELKVYLGLGKTTKEDFENLFDMKSTVENEIALNLGYANNSSNGYRSVRNRVRAVVKVYIENA